MQIGWFDLNLLTDNKGWLSDESDKEVETIVKPEEKKVVAAIVVEKVKGKEKVPKGSTTKKQTQELGVIGIVDTKLEVMLGQFEQKRIEES